MHDKTKIKKQSHFEGENARVLQMTQLVCQTRVAQRGQRGSQRSRGIVMIILIVQKTNTRVDKSTKRTSRLGKGCCRLGRVTCGSKSFPAMSRSLRRAFKLCGNLRAKSQYPVIRDVFEARMAKGSEHTLEHRVDHFEGLVDLLSNLRTSEHDLATDKDEKHDFRLQPKSPVSDGEKKKRKVLD